MSLLSCSVIQLAGCSGCSVKLYIHVLYYIYIVAHILYCVMSTWMTYCCIHTQHTFSRVRVNCVAPFDSPQLCVCLFSWLPQTHPRGGPRRRWRDVIRKDLKEMGVPENSWYKKATTSKVRWRHMSHINQHWNWWTTEAPAASLRPNTHPGAVYNLPANLQKREWHEEAQVPPGMKEANQWAAGSHTV